MIWWSLRKEISNFSLAEVLQGSRKSGRFFFFMTVEAWEKIQVHFCPLDCRWEFSKSAKREGHKDYSKIKNQLNSYRSHQFPLESLFGWPMYVLCVSFWRNDELFPAADNGRPQVLWKSFSDHCLLVVPLLFKICCNLEDENICGAKTCLGSPFLCPHPWVRHFCTLKRGKFPTEMFN